MRQMTRLILLSILGLMLSGCLKLTVNITLKPDGSGTLVFSQLIPEASLKEAVELAKTRGVDTSLSKMKDQIHKSYGDELLLKEAGKQFGKVSFTKVDSVDKGGYVGVTVTYGFQTINDVVISSITPIGMADQGGVKYGVRFNVEPATRTLIITTTDADAAEQQPMDEEQVSMLMQQLEETNGAGLTLDVSFPGKIIQTDATEVNAENDRITLLYADLDTLKTEKEALMKAMKTNNSFEGLLKLKLKGIRAEKQGNVLTTTF